MYLNYLDEYKPNCHSNIVFVITTLLNKKNLTCINYNQTYFILLK